jgi:hypothetical protein
MKELEYKITTEQIQALLEGKKLVFQYQGQPQITLYPPNYGVFMTYEKLAELRRKIGFQALIDTKGFFEEIVGKEMTEKMFTDRKIK